MLKKLQRMKITATGFFVRKVRFAVYSSKGCRKKPADDATP